MLAKPVSSLISVHVCKQKAVWIWNHLFKDMEVSAPSVMTGQEVKMGVKEARSLLLLLQGIHSLFRLFNKTFTKDYSSRTSEFCNPSTELRMF